MKTAVSNTVRTLKDPRKYIKAIGAAVVATAAYLVGVLGPEDTLADVTTVQWLGLVVSLGGVFGITYGLKNRT